MVKSLFRDYFIPMSNLEAVCNICGKVYGTKLGSTSTFTSTLLQKKRKKGISLVMLLDSAHFCIFVLFMESIFFHIRT